MRGVYILLGLTLIAIPSLACGMAFDAAGNNYHAGFSIEKLPDIFRVGFMLSSPVSLPLAILGAIIIARGITGRCIFRSKKVPIAYMNDIRR